jgi:general secretion pathway protein G
MRKIRPTTKHGFTFIELLVVVTIIAVMAAVGMVSYRSANIRSRDGKRKADLEQLRTALEIYRADNSVYPATGSLSSLTTTYIQAIPKDPMCLGASCTSGFVDYTYTRNTTTTYTLCACKLEQAGTETDYCVYNP